MTWPSHMINLQVLQRKWLQSKDLDYIESYHPKLIGFERFLKSYRTRGTYKMEFKARIDLTCQVQTHIFENVNLGWSESIAKVVYVELRGQEDQYGAAQDNDSFEVCKIVKLVIFSSCNGTNKTSKRNSCIYRFADSHNMITQTLFFRSKKEQCLDLINKVNPIHPKSELRLIILKIAEIFRMYFNG